MIINSVEFKHGRFTIIASTWDDGQLTIEVLNNKTGEQRTIDELGSDTLRAEIIINVMEKLGLAKEIELPSNYNA